MIRVIHKVGIARVALVAIALGVAAATPASAATLSAPQRVASDYDSAASAGVKFQTQFEAEAASYGSTSEETFASTLSEQANSFVTPLETEQQAILNLMVVSNLNTKSRLAAAVFTATITRFVYVLGLSGFAAGGTTGIEAWAKTFQSTKILYQQQGKTFLGDLGFKLTS